MCLSNAPRSRERNIFCRCKNVGLHTRLTIYSAYVDTNHKNKIMILTFITNGNISVVKIRLQTWDRQIWAYRRRVTNYKLTAHEKENACPWMHRSHITTVIRSEDRETTKDLILSSRNNRRNLIITRTASLTRPLRKQER